MNRAVEAAVFENGRASILAEGLAYDRCLVGVVTNIDPDDSLPEFTSRTPSRSPPGLRTQVDVVLPEARPCSTPTTRGGRDGRAVRRRGDLLRHRPGLRRCWPAT
jgi:hypothetical protein